MSGDPRCRGEQGVTLMELLLAILILGLIAVPLTTSIIVGLKTTDKTNTQLTNGNSADFASIYFARDVRNSMGLNASPCAGTTNQILNIDIGSGTTITYSSPTGTTLVRTVCGGAGGTKTLASGLTSAPTLAPSPPPANWTSLALTLSGQSNYGVELRVSRRTS